MKIGHFIVLFITVIFIVITVATFAAGDSYIVIKNQKGVCEIIKAQEKTPQTLAGPFKTKEEAQKAKKKECPYVVVKDKKGVCKIIKSQEKESKKTLAGPFKTKEEAQKAKKKEKKCSKISSPPSKSTKPSDSESDRGHEQNREPSHDSSHDSEETD
ncbi:MAG: hypothetical protein ACP5VS_10310 [Desulfomonilaceae bacterium]